MFQIEYPDPLPIFTSPVLVMRSLSSPLVSNLKRPDAPDSPLILADVFPQFRPLPFPSVAAPTIPNVEPSKVKFASPFKLTPLPPVITLLSALFAMVACAGNEVRFEPSPYRVSKYPFLTRRELVPIS